jgi:excinuclease UvrABC ATPase subunit
MRTCFQIVEGNAAVETLAQTRISFNASISACEKAAQWEFALSLLWYMPRLRLLPNVFSFNDGFSACKTCQALYQSSRYADLSLDEKQLTRTASTSWRLHHNPKAGYDYLANATQLAAESSSRTNVNVCTTDDITKSSMPVSTTFFPAKEETNIAHLAMLFDRNITDGQAMICSVLTLASATIRAWGMLSTARSMASTSLQRTCASSMHRRATSWICGVCAAAL